MFEDKHPAFTPLSDLGEFGVIERLTKHFTLRRPSSKLGIGDDAAVLHFEGTRTVVSTDLLVEGVHFNLAYTGLKHLGYKAVVVNLSDIYAMNATATQITVSIAVSNRFSIEALEELYEGITIAADHYNVDVIGGDTTSSAKGLVISVTAIGEAPAEEIVCRKGASEGDLLMVSGDLGAAYLGWQILERERQVFEVNPQNKPDLEPYAYLIERQLKPEARKDLPPLFKSLRIKPTAMIDVSDGLSSEILHLAKASGLGCRLYEDKIPLSEQTISACEELNLDAATVALNGGEDYELLFTISQKDYPKVKNHPDMTPIGHITGASDCLLITREGQEIPLKAKGWKSF